MSTNIGWEYFRNYYYEDNEALDLNLIEGQKGLLESFRRLDRNNRLDVKESEKAQDKFFNDKNNFFTGTAFTLASGIDFAKQQFTLFTTYPGLLTGAGYNHELNAKGEMKLGFYFDYTSGLPVLPGSSIKGVVRSMFPDFTADEGKLSPKAKKKSKVQVKWLIAQINNIAATDFLTKWYNPVEQLTDDDTAKIKNLFFELFEGKDKEGQALPIAKRDIFFDAQISSAGKNNCILGTDAITPHIKSKKTAQADLLKNPTPITFFKVLPEVGFTFYFDLKDGALTAAEKQLLIQKILLTHGVGAKTNVGYGQFSLQKYTAQNATGNQAGNTQSTVPQKNLNPEIKDFSDLKTGDIIDGIVSKLSGGVSVNIGFAEIKLLGASQTGFKLGQELKLKVEQAGKRYNFTIVQDA